LSLRKKLILLNVVLLALIGWISWRMRQQSLAAQANEQKVLRSKVKAPAAPSVAPVPRPQPFAAASYDGIAQKMLFAKDRNPVVVIDVAPPKPLPPLPVAHGVMNLGDGPMVILSEAPGRPHRAYVPGEKVGEYKLISATNEEIVLEFDGRQVKKRIDELTDRSGKEESQHARSEAPAERQAQADRAPEPVSAGPGKPITGEIRACVPGDTTPPGTVINGLRKIVNDTPFGKACRWEPVR